MIKKLAFLSPKITQIQKKRGYAQDPGKLGAGWHLGWQPLYLAPGEIMSSNAAACTKRSMQLRGKLMLIPLLEIVGQFYNSWIWEFVKLLILIHSW